MQAPMKCKSRQRHTTVLFVFRATSSARSMFPTGMQMAQDLGHSIKNIFKNISIDIVRIGHPGKLPSNKTTMAW